MRRVFVSRARRAGFTLVELMIAVSIGFVVISAAYYLGTTSSRSFNELMRMTELQTGVRGAMEQLERDIQRAGFMATADSSRLTTRCMGDASLAMANANVNGGTLYGARVTSDGSMADTDVQLSLHPGGTTPTRADSLVLVGNYETGDTYQVASEFNDSTLMFQTSSESFRRSFVIPTQTEQAGKFAKERFDEVFRAGRLLRIESGGYVFFRRVGLPNTDADGIYPSITLASAGGEAIPKHCLSPSMSLVTPLSMIRYQVETLPANGDFARLAADPKVPGSGSRVALIRSELDPTDESVIAGSQRLVLDYVVEFQVDAVVRNQGAGLWDTLTPATNPSVDSPIERFRWRALRVTLGGRASSIDVAFRGPPPRTHWSNPLLSFPIADEELLGSRLGHARVRSFRREVFMPNMGF